MRGSERRFSSRRWFSTAVFGLSLLLLLVAAGQSSAAGSSTPAASEAVDSADHILTSRADGVLSASWDHTCGLKFDGRAECWGLNDGGQAEDQIGPFAQVAAGVDHSCGLEIDGDIDCWGDNEGGRAEDQAGPFIQVSAGLDHTCGLKPNGSVACWGSNWAGQAKDQAGPFRQISLGRSHSCGLKPDGVAVCWGYYSDGRPGPFSQISAGYSHTCGLKLDGSIDCWGDNDYGQAEDQSGSYTQVSASVYHTCGLMSDGSIDCWGDNDYGQAEDQASFFTQVAAGSIHSCGLKADGSVDCWGNNRDGRAERHPGPFGPYIPPNGPTTRVSVSSAGNEANNNSDHPDISADGRYVAFFSGASNLVPDDTNDTGDIFVHDRKLGKTTRVSVNSAGSQANKWSYHPAISADGRYVAFGSEASNLVAGDTNNVGDIFVHDLKTSKTIRVSVDSDGNQSVGSGSFRPAISADGRTIAFYSGATNLVPNDITADDVFVHDRETGKTTRVSVSSAGVPGNSYSRDPAISADGRYVAFWSIANNLVTGDTNEWDDIFVHDRETGKTIRVSVDSDGKQADDYSESPSISADGRYVAFASPATNLVEDDTHECYYDLPPYFCWDVFVHDLKTSKTTRVSVDSAGNQSDDQDSLYPAISANGRYVTFESYASNLVNDDTQMCGTEPNLFNCPDIFVHDRHTGRTMIVSRNSNGDQANDYSMSAAISRSGQYVAYRSFANNLVSDDKNNEPDIFAHDRGKDYNYLPAVEIAPGVGWKVGIQVQNGGGSAAPIALTAYDAVGKSLSCGTVDTPPGHSANFLSYRECALPHPPLGSGVLSADGQPLSSIVMLSNNDFQGSGFAGASYTGTSEEVTSTRLFFPLVKQDHNSRTTAFSVQNVSDKSNDISAVFRVNGQEYTRQYKNIPAFTSIIITPADASVPGGFGQVGSLTVTGTQALAGGSLEHNQDVAMAENLQASTAFVADDSDRTLFCPLVRNGHTSKGLTSGVQVQNINFVTNNVKFIYTSVDGGTRVTRSKTIAPGASATFYAPSEGVPDGSLGSVTLEGDNDIVAVVNERGVLTNGRAILTTYACFGVQSTTDSILIPLYKEFYKGNTTGIQIQNVSGDGQSATVTLEYQVSGPGSSSGQATFSHKTPVVDGASITFWGVSDLNEHSDLFATGGDPSSLMGTYGSVVIKSDQPVVAIVNEATYGLNGTASNQDSKNYEGFNVE